MSEELKDMSTNELAQKIKENREEIEEEMTKILKKNWMTKQNNFLNIPT